jgi:plasmid replication initiation protein
MQTLAPASTPVSRAQLPEVIAVQHNALVNARFNFGTLEMRLFLAMLGRIRRQDKLFTECHISVRELAPEGGTSVPYAEVALLVKGLARRAIDIEVLGEDGRRQKELGITSIPLMSIVSYTKAAGKVVARFNDDIRPYLLQLRDNFTKAEIKQLQKLKSAPSHRIYWLLKEYVAFGRRTIAVPDLRNLLGLTTEYVGRFDHFRARILDRAQQELAQTDLPFTYELVRQGRHVTAIRFLFAPVKVVPVASEPVLEEWQETLLAVGIARKSLALIQQQLAAGDYDEGYITYVLKRVQAQALEGKVKKKAGAVYKALTEGYLLADYRATAASAPTRSTRRTTAGSPPRQRAKLEAELADAQNSLHWLQQPATKADYLTNYPAYPERLAEHIAAATAKLEALRQQVGFTALPAEAVTPRG